LTSVNLDADIAVIMIIYILAYRGERGAGIFALGQGLLMDIFSGGAWGCFTILYLMIFLFIKFFSLPFDLFSAFGQIAVVFFAVLIKDILMIPLLHLFSIDIDISFSNFLFIFSALFSGIVAPFIFYFINLLIRLFHGAKEES